jgi:hypothetical protein
MTLFFVVPIIVEIETVLCPSPRPASFSKSSGALIVWEALTSAFIDARGNARQAGINVFMCEGPDACCGCLGRCLGVVGNVIPSLADSRVLERGHYDYKDIKS